MKTKLLFLMLVICGLFLNAQTALHFDGINNFVVGTNDATLNLTQGTIEAQIKTSNAGSGYRGIVIKQYNYGIFLNSNILYGFEWNSGRTFNSGINLADGIWHHVAFSFNSGVSNGSKLYIDGLPVLTFTYTVANFDHKIDVGNGKDDDTVSQFFNGEIDQVRVWNTVRTDSEILASYNKCLTGTESGLVMLWQFEEGTGATATDSSGNSNNGTLTNMDTVSDWVTGYNCSSPNLLAYYSFNGNANDESGNNHNGTVNGATLTTDRFGNTHRAYYFDGVDNYIDIGDWENGGPMSFTFWARWDAFNNYSRIIDLGNGSSSNNIIISNYQTNNGLFFSTYKSGETKLINTNTITQNQWDFYAASFDSNGVMTLYKNGEQIAQKTDGVTPNTILRTQQFIGKSNFTADGYFNGAIDELKIYNKTLTQEEIKNEYSDLIAYYPFNGNASDESGNNHDGTVNGATLTNDRFGNTDSAYLFNGSTNSISIPDDSQLNLENNLSISAWVKPTSFPSLTYNMILGKSNYTTKTNYLLRIIQNGYIMFEYKTITTSTDNPVLLNQWNHIVVVSNGTVKKIYVNNVLAATTATSSPYGLVTNPLTIGARTSPSGEYFNGSIDDIRIYSMALTDNQVSSLYNNNTLAIQKINLNTDSTFYVYNNMLYFKNTQNLSDIKNVEVYNLLGQKVFETSKIEGQIKLQNLAKGIHFLKIGTNNGNYNSLKFIAN